MESSGQANSPTEPRTWPARSGYVALAMFSALGAALSIFSSCSTVTRTVVEPLHIEGATFAGNHSCTDCHAAITRKFHASPHARVFVRSPGEATENSCESCHGPASKHVQTGGQGRDKFIINPGKAADACFRCHVGTHTEFRLPHHHPVIEGQMNCVQCHDPHGHDIMKPAGGLAMAQLNQSCAPCHRDQARPFVFEHEAMREGCIVCHNPHGAVHDKLLVQRDANLCLKCHAQTQGAPGSLFIGKIDHAAFVRQGTCWSAGCHSAVHGSNINPKLQY